MSGFHKEWPVIHVRGHHLFPWSNLLRRSKIEREVLSSIHYYFCFWPIGIWVAFLQLLLPQKSLLEVLILVIRLAMQHLSLMLGT